MTPLVECVPNFSEGRNPDVLRSLIEAVAKINNVVLLDQHIDPDHNRAVLTFAGDPQAVAVAAFETVRVALARIDLTGHVGEHPHIGAADVVPFVPIKGGTMAECVDLARQVGARIGSELRLPVFLYEEACSFEERKGLETIRRGGLLSLATRMATDPLWTPDFGPDHLHPTAGAVAVGARWPLIAYNVVLDSQDVTLAKRIARNIRTATGGLPCVKAIGLELKSRRLVQVSMNLTNYRVTPIPVAFAAIKKEADQMGINIVESELVGLVPREALIHATSKNLQFPKFTPEQELESRLEREGFH